MYEISIWPVLDYSRYSTQAFFFLIVYTQLEFSILGTSYLHPAGDNSMGHASPTTRQDVDLLDQVTSRSLGAQMGASTQAGHGSRGCIRSERLIWGFRTSCGAE